MFIQIMRTDIYVEQIGTEGTNVLLLHGWGCSTQHFAPIAKAISRTNKVTLFDFPAHGQSSKPLEPWNLHQFAELTAQLIIKLEIAPCNIVAHSFGGRVALLLAVEYPHLIGKLVLTGCAGIRKEQTPAQKHRLQAFKRYKRFFESLKSIDFLKPAATMAIEFFTKKYGSADYCALDENMRKTFNNIILQDLRSDLALIQKPVLLVWGENDQETPLWMARIMEKEIPDAGLVIFTGRGHYAYLQEWGRFSHIVQVFLGGRE